MVYDQLGQGPIADGFRYRLKYERLRQRKTLAALAAEMKGMGRSIAQNTLGLIENGYRRASLDDAVAICQVLGLDPLAALVTRPEDFPEPSTTVVRKEIVRVARKEGVTNHEALESAIDSSELIEAGLLERLAVAARRRLSEADAILDHVVANRWRRESYKILLGSVDARG